MYQTITSAKLGTILNRQHKYIVESIKRLIVRGFIEPSQYKTIDKIANNKTKYFEYSLTVEAAKEFAFSINKRENRVKVLDYIDSLQTAQTADKINYDIDLELLDKYATKITHWKGKRDTY